MLSNIFDHVEVYITNIWSCMQTVSNAKSLLVDFALGSKGLPQNLSGEKEGSSFPYITDGFSVDK